MKKRILFIEDEAEIVAMLKMRLEANNYEVIAAYDGKEGLKKAQEQSPHLILLDIIMPKIDGLTLCRCLKNDFKLKHIPIIILSGSGERDLAQRCQAAGADDLIIKPFDSKELLDKIAKYLAG